MNLKSEFNKASGRQPVKQGREFRAGELNFGNNSENDP